MAVKKTVVPVITLNAMYLSLNALKNITANIREENLNVHNQKIGLRILKAYISAAVSDDIEGGFIDNRTLPSDLMYLSRQCAHLKRDYFQMPSLVDLITGRMQYVAKFDPKDGFVKGVITIDGKTVISLRIALDHVFELIYLKYYKFYQLSIMVNSSNERIRDLANVFCEYYSVFNYTSFIKEIRTQIGTSDDRGNFIDFFRDDLSSCNPTFTVSQIIGHIESCVSGHLFDHGTGKFFNKRINLPFDAVLFKTVRFPVKVTDVKVISSDVSLVNNVLFGTSGKAVVVYYGDFNG